MPRAELDRAPSFLVLLAFSSCCTGGRTRKPDPPKDIPFQDQQNPFAPAAPSGGSERTAPRGTPWTVILFYLEMAFGDRGRKAAAPAKLPVYPAPLDSRLVWRPSKPGQMDRDSPVAADLGRRARLLLPKSFAGAYLGTMAPRRGWKRFRPPWIFTKEKQSGRHRACYMLIRRPTV
jgi:hypothetical protein